MHSGVASCSTVNNSTKGKKWWWNQDCLVMRNINRLFHYIGKKSGKPDYSGVVFKCYKAARKAYRTCCREAVNNKTLNKFKLIEKLYNVIRLDVKLIEPAVDRL